MSGDRPMSLVTESVTPTPEQYPVQPSRRPQSLFYRLQSVGVGVGIEILGADLQVTLVRVRPDGIRILDLLKITNFRLRPAADWGSEYQLFLKKQGFSHLAALVLLPRAEVTLRQIEMPGVKEEDIDGAVQFQLDSMHPYGNTEVFGSSARLNSRGDVLVAIAERRKLDEYANLFSEAGINTAGFTVSSAVLNGALRALDRPAEAIFAFEERPLEVEFYGESPAKPVFSAVFDDANLRTIDHALSELRLPATTAMMPLASMLRNPENHGLFPQWTSHPVCYATAICAAAPREVLGINLLPPEYRRSSSRTLYLPTLILGALALLMAGGWWYQQRLEKVKFMKLIQEETTRFEPVATRLAKINKDIDTRTAQIKLLDEYRPQAKKDLDALNELTRLLPSPAFLQQVSLNPQELQLSGSAPNAPDLIKQLDSSPLFQNSEFTMAPAAGAGVEQFSIKSKREGAK